jgi:hypothetical protein
MEINTGLIGKYVKAAFHSRVFYKQASKCMGCANHPYTQLRAKLNGEGRSSVWSSRRLTKGASGSHLMTHVRSRSTATVERSVRGASPNLQPTLSTFSMGGNRSTQRKPTTFSRALTNSFPISVIIPMWGSNPQSQRCRRSPFSEIEKSMSWRVYHHVLVVLLNLL